jgi:hypothetical protein
MRQEPGAWWRKEATSATVHRWAARFFYGLVPAAAKIFGSPHPPALADLLALPEASRCAMWGVYAIILVPKGGGRPWVYVGSGTGACWFAADGSLSKAGGVQARGTSHMSLARSNSS